MRWVLFVPLAKIPAAERDERQVQVACVGVEDDVPRWEPLSIINV